MLLLVTNVTDVKTSQTSLAFYQECAFVLRLPGDSKFPTIASQWRRMPEGYLEAGYQEDEIAMALSVFLGKNIDALKIERMPDDQLKDRLEAVTNGKVIRFCRKAKVE